MIWLKKKFERWILCYDLLCVFQICTPILNNGQVTDNIEMNNGVLVTTDLIKLYLTLTPKQVGLSSEWYCHYTPRYCLRVADLDLSYSYFSNNFEKLVYNCVDLRMKGFLEAQCGGTLFFRLLTSELTVSNRANLSYILCLIKAYDIKKQHPGEDIQELTDRLGPVIQTFHTLSNKQFPPQFVENVAHVFTTTSVDDFNTQFVKLKDEIASMQIQIDITGSRVPSGAVLNDLKRCKFALLYACGLFDHHRGVGPWVNDSHKIKESHHFRIR